MNRLGLAFGLLFLCCASCDSPLVGAECRTGYSLCAGACVDLESDYRNCGMCGHSCGAFLCEQGVCSKSQLRDGGTAGDASMDGSAADGGMSDGGDGSAGNG
ncbi:MAG TPA: hypothetical protein VHZ95_19740, partial [Polyangiales bacterium]|nr:hypothetical protein [Polyangiales bacterium]